LLNVLYALWLWEGKGPVVATDGDGDDDDVVENCIPGEVQVVSHVYGYVDTSVWIFGNRLFCSASSF